MKRFSYKRGASGFLLLLASALIAPAHASHYSFSQGGFSGKLWLDGKVIHSFSNGKIQGTFDGADTSDKEGNPGADGLIYGINEDSNEISRFSLTFSGNEYFNGLFGLTKLPFEGSYLQYDIAKNKLELDFYWEGFHQPDLMNSFTGDLYEEFVISTGLKLNVDGEPSSVGSGVVYAFGTDKDGNLIDGYRDLSITMESDEKLQVTLVHTPIPRAFYLFAACLPFLVSVRTKRAVSV